MSMGSNKPLHYFAGGAVCAGLFSFLALLVLFTWRSKGAKDRQKKRYYFFGFVVGSFVFAGWAAALVYFIKTNNIDGEV